ncbi:MAG TPA: hypothetical protein PKN21_00970 [Bacteroidales bacterium]|nr:hypothetical protein [Bacteroidales bacterium]
MGTGAASVLASPFLQQLLPSALLHDLAQPSLASPSLAQAADDLASDLAQHDFAGASLLVLTFSVLALAAVVTFCADTVVTVKAKMRLNNEITRATFFINIIC